MRHGRYGDIVVVVVVVDVVVPVVVGAVVVDSQPAKRQSKMDCWSRLMESSLFSREGERKKERERERRKEDEVSPRVNV